MIEVVSAGEGLKGGVGTGVVQGTRREVGEGWEKVGRRVTVVEVVAQIRRSYRERGGERVSATHCTVDPVALEHRRGRLSNLRFVIKLHVPQSQTRFYHKPRTSRFPLLHLHSPLRLGDDAVRPRNCGPRPVEPTVQPSSPSHLFRETDWHSIRLLPPPCVHQDTILIVSSGLLSPRCALYKAHNLHSLHSLPLPNIQL